MGIQADTIYNSFQFADGEDRDDHDLVLRKFDAHFVPTVNTIHERANFRKRFQSASENVETYLRALYEMSATCGFAEGTKDNEIRDQLVVGISDRETSQKLQLKRDLTLAEAIDMCRTIEQVKVQMASQQPTAALDAVKTEKPNKQRQKQQSPQRFQRRQNAPKPTGQKCQNCGLVHKDPTYCPAKGKQCMSCRRYGHFRSVCRSRIKHTNEVVEDEEDGDGASFYLGSIDCGDTDPWRIKLTINKSDINLQADSGADVTCISEQDFERMSPRPDLRPPRFPLISPGGRVNCVGQFDATTTHKNKMYSFPVCVIAGKSPS